MGVVDVGFWIGVALIGLPLFLLGWVARGAVEVMRREDARRRRIEQLHPSRGPVKPYYLPKHLVDDKLRRAW